MFRGFPFSETNFLVNLRSSPTQKTCFCSVGTASEHTQNLRLVQKLATRLFHMTSKSNCSRSYFGSFLHKNVLQEWHAYIRTMVQFHVLGEMFDSSGNFTSHLHRGVLQGVPGTLIPNCVGSCHGQILIETATHSFRHGYIRLQLESSSDGKIYCCFYNYLSVIIGPISARSYHPAVHLFFWFLRAESCRQHKELQQYFCKRRRSLIPEG